MLNAKSSSNSGTSVAEGARGGERGPGSGLGVEWRFPVIVDASLARALRAIWKRDGPVDDDAESTFPLQFLAVR